MIVRPRVSMSLISAVSTSGHSLTSARVNFSRIFLSGELTSNSRRWNDDRLATNPIAGVHDQVTDIPALVNQEIVHVTDPAIGRLNVKPAHIGCFVKHNSLYRSSATRVEPQA